jgi:F-type H+-transporting ATPase subunit b
MISSMSPWILLAVAEHEAATGGVAARMGLNAPHLLAQIIVFSVLALALKKYAFSPVLEVLEARRKTIAESLDNAEKVKRELAEAQKARAEIIAQANTQATQMLQEAQKSAQALSEQRLQEAVAQAEALVKKAHAASALDRDRMMAELKQEVGRLVVETARAVTGKVLTSEDQRRLNEETAKTLVG